MNGILHRTGKGEFHKIHWLVAASICASSISVLFDALQIPAGMTDIQWTLVDSTRMRPESTGIHQNGTGIH
jgi:hypothetical protein